MIAHQRSGVVHRLLHRVKNAADADTMVTGMIFEFVMRNADDLNITGASEEAKRTHEFDREPLSWYVTDEGTTKLLGLLILKQGTNQSTRHVGQLRIAVDKDAWNQGIGSQLLATAIEEAPKLGITRLEATPYMPLDPYKYHLFINKGGFEWEGVRKRAAKKDGEDLDVLSLVRFFYA